MSARLLQVTIIGSKAMKKLKAKFKLWLSTETTEGVFGDGKWRLLEAIETKGSLSAVSKYLHISYRKAWGDLNKAEKCLAVELVSRQRGGSRGGQTGLTTQGQNWLKAYTKFRLDIEKAMEAAFRKHIKELTK